MGRMEKGYVDGVRSVSAPADERVILSRGARRNALSGAMAMALRKRTDADGSGEKNARTAAEGCLACELTFA